MMIVPPKSAKTAVRLANASMVFNLSQLYSLLISKWIIVEEANASGEKPSQDVRELSRWSRQFRADFTMAGAALQTLEKWTKLAQWEGSFRGAWPVEQYTELNDVETEMLSYLAQVCLQAWVFPLFNLFKKARRRGLSPGSCMEDAPFATDEIS